MNAPTMPAPATSQGGPFRVLIKTAVGWSQSRRKYKRLHSARKSALWFARQYGVELARVLDTVKQTIAFEAINPRFERREVSSSSPTVTPRKPR